MRAPSPVRIGIIAHVGNGNLGDEALVTAVVANLRERMPEVEFVAFTMYPSDTVKRHGIPAFPIRRGLGSCPPREAEVVSQVPTWHEQVRTLLRRLPPLFAALRAGRRAATRLKAAVLEVPFLVQAYHRLSGLSLLVVAGSQQLSDGKGGPWWFPYSLFLWTSLARLRGIPVALASVGVGPLDSRLSRWFARRVIRMAAHRSFRDTHSLEVLRSLGVRDPGTPVPDLALSLPASVLTSREGAERTVAINAMPAFIWRDYDEPAERAIYSRYADALSAFATWLLDRGYRVAFVPTQFRGDPPVLRDILRRVAASRPQAVRSGRAFFHPVNGLDDVVAGLAGARLVVATRYHGVVLGYAAGRPVLALAYHPKTRDLAALLGCTQHVLGAHDLRVGELQAAFLDLERRSDEIAAQLPARLSAARAALAEQFDRLAALARRQPSGLHNPSIRLAQTP